ncbi:MAG: DinB family protein [Phycisphaerales bacterium]
MSAPSTVPTPPPGFPAHPERAELGGLSTAELVARFRIGVERYDRRVLDLNDAALDTAFRPEAGVGRWPCRVLLGHMADADLVWNHRMRRAVGELNPLFSLWDEDAFIDANIYGTPDNGARYPIGGFIASVHSGRQWVGEWLLTLTPAQWARTGMHPDRGGITLRTMLELTTWHLEHHAWYLNLKVARLV